jgi:hypothetical protein
MNRPPKSPNQPLSSASNGAAPSFAMVFTR